METKNAIIISTTISIEDHGCLSVWLTLDYGGSCQGFGGYALYLLKGMRHHKVNEGYAGHFIARCMQVAGVVKWDDIVGKTIRVKSDSSKIQSIGHIVNNDWFTPENDLIVE